MADHEPVKAPEPSPPAALTAVTALPPVSAALASAIGNAAMAGVARRARGDPRARAAVARPSAAGLRLLARDGPDGGTALADAGVPAGAPAGAMAPPTAVQTPAVATAAPAPGAAAAAPATPNRDQVIRNAIAQVLAGFQNLTMLVPPAMPPAPSNHPHAAPAPATPGPPLGETAPGGAGPTATESGPVTTPLTFASPYYINRASGDSGQSGGAHALGAPGVNRWFTALPADVRVGKGTPGELRAAMQQALDQGLLNGTWPPTPDSAREFMKTVGLGVDCSGFVYQALSAAGAALTAAGLPGMTSPFAHDIANTGSQSIGHDGGTAVTRPGDLLPGDIIQMAPNASHAVGHIRIITDVRSASGFVEYDTAESTTRVGSGPQASTWRLPAGGPMDTAHLQVRNDADGTWGPEPSGRPSSYWRRLGVPAAAPPGPSVAPWRAGRRLARDAPRAGGWNAGDRTVAATWRIPVGGLTQGLATDNPHPATAEEGAHRAVAIVPQSVTAANLEVLLHFHGNNLGERERRTRSDSGMGAGTVRDVEADLIPQQLAASGRNMVAVLPQGTTSSGTLASKFGITDPRTYVTEVLARVVTEVNTLDPTKQLASLTPVRIVISGHSGGGPATVAAAAALQAGSGAPDADWIASPPLLLFDAINGIDELHTVSALMLRWLADDKRRLDAAGPADGAALLARRGLKLRSTYTSGVYQVTNSKHDPRTYQYPPHPPVTIPASESLEARRDQWFAANASALGSLAGTLKDQYVIEHVGGSHDFTVGAGHLETGPRTAVPGVTPAPGAAPGSAEAPGDSHGSLERALGLLSPADRIAPTAESPAPATPLARMVRVARQGTPAAPIVTRPPPGASGTHDGQRYVVYQDEVRVGGTKAWRNNNPGNIVGGAWANGRGAIGTAFGMAVFPDEATGGAAIPALLHTTAYQARTIREAISMYAPPSENDTESYIQSVVRGAGVPDTTRLSALTDAQLDLIVGVIRRVEGWTAGTTYHRDGPDWVRALLGAAPAAQPGGADAGASEGGAPDAGAP